MAASLAFEMNGGDDEDEALRQAIAMSLGETPSGNAGAPDGTSGHDGLVDLTSSSPPPPTKATAMDLPAASTPPKAPAAAAPPASSMLGLDRKKMEEERLARLKKRKAPDSEPAGQGPAHDLTERPKRVRRPTPSAVPPSLPQATAGSRATRPTGTPTGTPTAAVAQHPGTRLPYPRGVVMKTWAAGQPRTGDDIKIEEVLQADDLELAVLSSFVWDEAWLLSKLNLGKTKVLLIAFADSETQVGPASKAEGPTMLMASPRRRKCAPTCPGGLFASVSPP